MESLRRYGAIAAVLAAVACGDDAGTGGSGTGGASTGGSGGAGGAPTGPRVDTAQGEILGLVDGDTHVFLGVPFAAPPVGDLRLRAPRPPEAFDGLFDATKTAAFCPQLGPLDGKYVGNASEDCLTLNVWTPAATSDSPRPVMVWIHGGGYVIGSGAESGYVGRLLSERTGHVVVTVNYRLGALGFLSLPELVGESDGAGNFGLLDQRSALEWVQANIAAFGGDPENVTIFGESAGGASVCQHVVSPGSAGLFHRAILQSGPCDLVVTEEEAFTAGAPLYGALGCAEGDLACVREADVATLVEALPTTDFTVGSLGTGFYPVVDGDVLPEAPSALLEKGDFTRVPTVLGTNADEASLFFALGGTMIETEDEFRELAEGLVPGFSADVVERYVSLFPTVQEAALAAVGDAGFICPTRRAARALASETPTFLYHFTHAPESLLGDLGAFHSAEIRYVFANPSQLVPSALTPEETLLFEAMSGRWGALASAGAPTLDGDAEWPAYDATSDEHLDIGLAGGRPNLLVDANLKQSLCDFWDGLSSSLP
jgi:para-nitrobenzyl esterase